MQLGTLGQKGKTLGNAHTGVLAFLKTGKIGSHWTLMGANGFTGSDTFVIITFNNWHRTLNISNSLFEKGGRGHTANRAANLHAM